MKKEKEKKIIIKGKKDLLEKVSKIKKKDIQEMSEGRKENVILELQTHQIELEMMNQELRNTQLELEESRNRYADLYDFAPNGYFTFDSEGNILEVNLNGAKLLKRERRFLINTRFNQFVSPEYKNVFSSYFKQIFETGEKQAIELRLKNGSKGSLYVQMESVVVKNGKNKIRQCRTAIFDITQRKQSEIAMRESEQRFRDLAETASDAFITIDEEGTIVFVNSAAKRIFGFNFSEMLDKRLDILLPQYLKYVHRSGKTRFLDSGEKHLAWDIIEIPGLHKSGKEIPLELSFGEYVIAEKRYFTGIARDITERKMAEEVVKKYTQELQTSRNLLEKKAIELAKLNVRLAKSEGVLKALNESKDKFFAIISHNLKNPFTILLGLSNILLCDIDEMDKAQTKEITLKINQSANRIYKLLDNLLKWSVVQFGKLDYNPVKINLNELVDDSVRLLIPNAVKKNISMDIQIDKDIVVEYDFNILESIIQILITNAIKFTNMEGKVTISAMQKEKNVQVSVVDTGIGMNKKILRNLFKIEQVHSTPGTANEIGTGLGLILCNELIQSKGGKIWVDSEVGKGSNFTFSLPVAKE